MSRVTIERITFFREDKLFWSAMNKVLDDAMENDDLTDDEFDRLVDFNRLVKDMVEDD